MGMDPRAGLGGVGGQSVRSDLGEGTFHERVARETHLNEFICLQCITDPRAEVAVPAACNRGSSILLYNILF
jgi:hypothetical protein